MMYTAMKFMTINSGDVSVKITRMQVISLITEMKNFNIGATIFAEESANKYSWFTANFNIIKASRTLSTFSRCKTVEQINPQA